LNFVLRDAAAQGVRGLRDLLSNWDFP
jgi:hypothetical protein